MLDHLLGTNSEQCGPYDRYPTLFQLPYRNDEKSRKQAVPRTNVVCVPHKHYDYFVDSKSSDRKIVRVQVPPPVLLIYRIFWA